MVSISGSGQLIQWDADVSKQEISIETIHLMENAQVHVRYDLMDSHIYICTPEVNIYIYINIIIIIIIIINQDAN